MSDVIAVGNSKQKEYLQICTFAAGAVEADAARCIAVVARVEENIPK
jgi:hypothetical protein